jgi:hypothetical protein
MILSILLLSGPGAGLARLAGQQDARGVPGRFDGGLHGLAAAPEPATAGPHPAA